MEIGITVGPPGFTSMDSTNCGSKIIWRKKKMLESSKIQNLNLPCAEPMWMLWYVGIPCYKLYANAGYMQVLCPFI